MDFPLHIDTIIIDLSWADPDVGTGDHTPWKITPSPGAIIKMAFRWQPNGGPLRTLVRIPSPL